jgi:hypothetical protein
MKRCTDNALSERINGERLSCLPKAERTHPRRGQDNVDLGIWSEKFG